MKKIKVIAITIVVALIVGFIAGIGGDLFSRSYLYSFSFLSDVYLPQQGQLGDKNVIIQEANRVIVEQDDRVAQVIETAAKTSAFMYSKKIAGVDYYPTDRIASAIPVTSDGWLVTYSTVSLNPASIVIGTQGTIYDVEEVRRDPSTNLTFIKAVDATLPVVKFAELENLAVGQATLLYDALLQDASVTYVADESRDRTQTQSQLVVSAESYDPQLVLHDETTLQGAPVMSLNGEVLGVATGTSTAIKMTYINFMLNQLLANGELQRPDLGLSYISTTQINGGLNEQGVQLIDGRLPAVQAGSPLADDLQEGDIIVAVEDNRLSDAVAFTDLLYDYSIGDVIKFSVVRGEEQFDVEYTLSVE